MTTETKDLIVAFKVGQSYGEIIGRLLTAQATLATIKNNPTIGMVGVVGLFKSIEEGAKKELDNDY